MMWGKLKFLASHISPLSLLALILYSRALFFGPSLYYVCKWSGWFTPHCWGRLVFLRPLSKIHTSHQYLDDLHWFDAIFKIFVCAVFEAIDVKGWSRLNFEAATSKICNHFRKFGCQPRKVRQIFVWQKVPKLWFICLFYCSSKTYSCK
jgi:hypothetical protein